jgi:hypothetical protein
MLIVYLRSCEKQAMVAGTSYQKDNYSQQAIGLRNHTQLLQYDYLGVGTKFTKIQACSTMQ